MREAINLPIKHFCDTEFFLVGLYQIYWHTHKLLQTWHICGELRVILLLWKLRSKQAFHVGQRWRTRVWNILLFPSTWCETTCQYIIVYALANPKFLLFYRHDAFCLKGWTIKCTLEPLQRKCARIQRETIMHLFCAIKLFNATQLWLLTEYLLLLLFLFLWECITEPYYFWLIAFPNWGFLYLLLTVVILWCW